MHRLPERIRAKLRVDPVTGCWLWTGSVNVRRYGYGQVRHEGRVRTVHRLVYELLVGPIPVGLHLDHVYEKGCRYKNCANPDHLEPVTSKENSRRRTALITHCPRGHEYTPENTTVSKGCRYCRACNRAKMKRIYHEKKKAAA